MSFSLSANFSLISRPDYLTESSHGSVRKRRRIKTLTVLDDQDRNGIKVSKVSEFYDLSVEKENLSGRVQIEAQLREEFQSAVVAGDIQRLKVILDKLPKDRAKVIANAPDENGNTPLLNLVFSDKANVACLLLLLDAGADLTISNHDGENFAHIAAYSGEDELLKSCLDRLSKDKASCLKLVNTPDRNGNTPLLNLILSNKPNVTCLRLLIDAGADPIVKNRDGHNFVHRVAYQGKEELLKSCLERFSNDKAFCLKLVNAPDENGNTPLLTLAHSPKGNVSCLHLLLNAGADPMVENHDSDNFVHKATYWGQAALLKGLLDRFSKDKAFCLKLINTRDKDGNTPLLNLILSDKPNVACLHVLLDAGADPMTSNHDGENFVHMAAYRGKDELLKSFLGRFSKDRTLLLKLVNALDKNGNTPILNLAFSDNSNVTCLFLLIDAGADPTISNQNGKNFVHRAAYWGKTNC